MRATSKETTASYAPVPTAGEEDDIEIPRAQAVAAVEDSLAMPSVEAARNTVSDQQQQQNGPEDNAIAWSDTFFRDRTDVVAVYDYDAKGIFAVKERCRLYASLAFFCVVALLVLVGCADDPDRLKAAMFWLGFLLFAWYCLHYNEMDRNKRLRAHDQQIPHTAIVQTGLLHVQPSYKGVSGYTILIPFSAMGQIKVQANSLETTEVSLQVKTADTGSEYVVQGGVPRACHGWTQVNALTHPYATFAFEGLVEPCRFKQLLMTMIEEDQQRRQQQRSDDAEGETHKM